MNPRDFIMADHDDQCGLQVRPEIMLLSLCTFIWSRQELRLLLIVLSAKCMQNTVDNIALTGTLLVDDTSKSCKVTLVC